MATFESKNREIEEFRMEMKKREERNIPITFVEKSIEKWIITKRWSKDLFKKKNRKETFHVHKRNTLISRVKLNRFRCVDHLKKKKRKKESCMHHDKKTDSWRRIICNVLDEKIPR